MIRSISPAFILALVIAGCGGPAPPKLSAGSDSRDSPGTQYRQSAMSEVRSLARRTCRQVPARVLVERLKRGRGQASANPNDVALLFAENVSIRPIPLQRAAYNGCVLGVKRQQRDWLHSEVEPSGPLWVTVVNVKLVIPGGSGLEVGAVALRTETELVLKSRRVVPGRLLDAGFEFERPDWREAANDLVSRHD